MMEVPVSWFIWYGFGCFLIGTFMTILAVLVGQQKKE